MRSVGETLGPSVRASANPSAQALASARPSEVLGHDRNRRTPSSYHWTRTSSPPVSRRTRTRPRLGPNWAIVLRLGLRFRSLREPPADQLPVRLGCWPAAE